MNWETEITVQVIRFLAVFGRMAGFILLMPLFGAPPVPMRWRMLFALAVTVAILPAIPPDWGTELSATLVSLPSLVVAVAREALVGIVAAFVLHLLQETWVLAGEYVSQVTGLSFATQLDPRLEQESSLFGSLFGLVALLLMLVLDVHLEVIRLGVASFASLPAGSFALDGSLREALGSLTGQMFSGALRLALPVFGVIALTQLVLAALARVCQEFEVMMLAFPLQIGLGFLVVAWALPAMVCCNRELTEGALSLLQGLLAEP